MCANKCDYKEINHEFERDYNFYFTDLNELDAKFNKMINDFIQVKNKEILDFINEKRNIRNQVYVFQIEHKNNLMKYYEKIVHIYMFSFYNFLNALITIIKIKAKEQIDKKKLQELIET